MPSIESFISLSTTSQTRLLNLAREAIIFALENKAKLTVDLTRFDAQLTQQACSFVTLHKSKQLRGCIGALVATQALVKDVVEHAHAAAFHDPRFPPVTAAEVPELQIEISILTPQQEISFENEADLLDQLVPDEDGLVLQDDYHHATFLPTVWQALPDKRRFLSELKRKAGMSLSSESSSMKAYRYHTLVFSD